MSIATRVFESAGIIDSTAKRDDRLTLWQATRRSGLSLWEMIGVGGLIFSLVLFGMALHKAPWFSWKENAVSDLAGKRGVKSGSAMYLNTSCIVMGMSLMVFQLHFLTHFKRKIKKLGVLLMMSSSIAFLSMGFFPETTGVIHFYVSVAFFVLMGLSFIPFCVSSLIYNEYKEDIGTSIYQFVSLTVIILIWCVQITLEGLPPSAISEMTSVIPYIVWHLILVLKLSKEGDIEN